ncbi:CocE/NonD family hydrolase [Mesorhizobium sp.]|uniref:CocE/NonD family hydrolase n=1 Tax=Mesorhizobium sp. TaxID=1871066 RepID=UPI000FE6F238|nr:MAG: CocE/NonD family hydrolase [Mesorhizobium sp.]
MASQETHLLQVPGAALATTVWRGDTKRQPAILARTPYDRLRYARAATFWTETGFAFIAQDTRGCGRSSGTWLPYANEATDGAATIEWLEQQEWYDGRVHLYGESYAAYSALSIASTIGPGKIASCVAMVPALGLFQTAFHPSGAFRLGDRIWWDVCDGAGAGMGQRADEMWPYMNFVCRHLPVAQIPAISPVPLRSFSRVVTRAHTFEVDCSQIRIPLLVLTGWQDCFLDNALTIYQNAIHAPTRMIIGPWNHELETAEPISQSYVDRALVQWVANDYAHVRDKRSSMYVLNGGPWLSSTETPAKSRSLQTLYLHPGAAPTQGVLREDRPDYLPSVGWLCDPYDPYPALGPDDDRSRLMSRHDLIAYSAQPLTAETIVAGRFLITLYMATTAPETEVHGVIVLVRAGSSQALVGAIGRCRPESVVSVVELTMSTAPICVRLRPGDVLKLELSSGAFPQYARHSNTLIDPLHASSLARSWQFVHHRSSMSSRLNFETLSLQSAQERPMEAG